MEIRTLIIEGEPYFVGKDVAMLLVQKKMYINILKNIGHSENGLK